jgi:hypothetical protein
MSIVLRMQLRRPRFSIAESSAIALALAVASVWPPVLVPTIEVVMVVVFRRAGLSLLASILTMFVVSFAAGLLLPPVINR